MNCKLNFVASLMAYKLFFYLLVSFINDSFCCANLEIPFAALHNIGHPGSFFSIGNKWMRRRNHENDCQVNGVYDCDCEYNKFYCNYENLVSDEGRKPH